MTTIETCYAVIGGDLDGVRGRLLTDERIVKFLTIFFARYELFQSRHSS